MSKTPHDYAEAHRQQLAKEWKQLEAGTPAQLVGVLRPDCRGCGQSQGEMHWTHSLEFLAWRLDDGPVRFRDLRVQWKQTSSRFAKWTDGLKDHEIIRLDVRFVEDSGPRGPLALLKKYRGGIKDDEMSSASRVLAEPVIRKDSRLGTLRLDRWTGQFHGRVKWGERRVRLWLSADDRGGFEAAQLAAGIVVEQQDAWHPRIAEAIAAKMYPLWQEVWREDQKNLSEKQFLAKIRASALSVYSGGVFEIWFDDSDLFGDHGVVVRGTSRGQIESVQLG